MLDTILNQIRNLLIVGLVDLNTSKKAQFVLGG